MRGQNASALWNQLRTWWCMTAAPVTTRTKQLTILYQSNREIPNECESHMALEYFPTFRVLFEALLRFLPSVTNTLLDYRTKNLMTKRNKQRLIRFFGLITPITGFDDVNKAAYPCVLLSLQLENEQHRVVAYCEWKNPQITSLRFREIYISSTLSSSWEIDRHSKCKIEIIFFRQIE